MTSERTIRVRTTMAQPIAPGTPRFVRNTETATIMVNRTWKSGGNSQARRLIGSALGWAGWRGGCGVAETWGAPDTPDAPRAPGAAHAATTRTTRITRAMRPIRPQLARRIVTR